MTDPITDLTVAALVFYWLALVLYFAVAFSTRTSAVYTGPTKFWTLSKEYQSKGAAPNHIRWAQITLKTAAFNGIQSLRCQLQGGVFYGATCVTVAFFVLFFSTAGSRQQVINMCIGFLALCASICFLQHMRFCYHLGFLVMFQQPKDNSLALNSHQTGAVSPAEGNQTKEDGNGRAARHRLTGALSTKNPFNQAVAVLMSEPQFVGQGLSPAGEVYPAHTSDVDVTLRHIEVEGNLDMYKHIARVAYVAQRHLFNFCLGLRLLLFIVPLALGGIGDGVLLASTVALLPVMWYMDSRCS